MRTNLFKVIGFAAMLLVLAQSRTDAHAMLERAEPRVGSEVGKAPSELKLWFSQNLEPAFSKVQVFDAAGKEVDKKDGHLSPDDRKLWIISLPPLPPGTYKVVWHVVSVDTHRTSGTFKLVVKQ